MCWYGKIKACCKFLYFILCVINIYILKINDIHVYWKDARRILTKLFTESIRMIRMAGGFYILLFAFLIFNKVVSLYNNKKEQKSILFSFSKGDKKGLISFIVRKYQSAQFWYVYSTTSQIKKYWAWYKTMKLLSWVLTVDRSFMLSWVRLLRSSSLPLKLMDCSPILQFRYLAVFFLLSFACIWCT